MNSAARTSEVRMPKLATPLPAAAVVARNFLRVNLLIGVSSLSVARMERPRSVAKSGAAVPALRFAPCGLRIISASQHAAHGFSNLRRADLAGFLQRRRVGDGNAWGAEAAHRRLEVAEQRLGHRRGDLGAEAAGRDRLVHHQ